MTSYGYQCSEEFAAVWFIVLLLKTAMRPIHKAVVFLLGPGDVICLLGAEASACKAGKGIVSRGLVSEGDFLYLYTSLYNLACFVLFFFKKGPCNGKII